MTPQQETDAKFWQQAKFIGKIVQDVRISPPPLTESDKEFFPMVDLDFPEKGIWVYWKGLEWPTKTFPYKETVEQVDDMKKVIMANVRSFAAMFKTNPLKALLFIIFFRKEMENTALDMLAEFHTRLREVRNKDHRYCRAMRELHRTFNVTNSNVKIRDIICMILEYDDAYRYRFQDVVVKLKKENLKNPRKELARLLSILSDKEGDQRMSEKWKKMAKMLIILRLKGDLQKHIGRFLNELNLDEMKMDVMDEYHAKKKAKFKWNFL